MGIDIPGLYSNSNIIVTLTDPVVKGAIDLRGSINVNEATPTLIYVSKEGSDTLGNGSFINPYLTLGKAATMVSSTKKQIILMPGTYLEDVTWPDITGIKIAAMIPGTVILGSVTAFALSIDPAASSGTWEATLQGVTVKHLTGDVGIQVNNTNVGKRINLYLNDVDFDAQTATDHSIDVNRAGAATDAIRIYMNGHGNTVEGLIDYLTESTDDRIRIWGYRLIGGVTVTGNVIMEVTYVNCGIKTSGETYGTGNVSSHFGCYNETDANPNDHTALADDADVSN